MKDDHEKTAETIWPDPPKDAREAKARRAAAQTINFAKLYGGRKLFAETSLNPPQS